MSEPIRIKARKPWLAAFASFGAPGLGQLYNGQIRRAVVLYLLALCAYPIVSLTPLTFSLLGISTLIVAGLAIMIAIVVDAWRQARNRSEYELQKWNRGYVYAGIIIANVFVVPPLIEFLFPSPIKSYKVISGAMRPTLEIGDRLVADLNAYKSMTPQRGDITLFAYPVDPSKDFVMRVVGLPGEIIKFREKMVYIDGKPLDDTWGVYDEKTSEPERRESFGPITLPRDEYFVMGDNRYRSYDSRFWGTVPLAAFRSKALYVYWAAEKSRMGRRVQ